jgi:predicted acetyltransferase
MVRYASDRHHHGYTDDFCGMASLDEMRAIGGRGYSGGVTETEYWSSVFVEACCLRLHTTMLGVVVISKNETIAYAFV